MRPYRIAAGEHCQKLWIDLDHIIAIHDPILPDDMDGLTWQFLPPSFTMVVAFRNDVLTYTAVPDTDMLSPMDVVVKRQEILDNVRRAHRDLLDAWKSK